MNNTLYDALIGPHANNDGVFLELDDGSTITFRSFVVRAAQMAGALRSADVEPGDRVVVQAPKLADTLALYVGCLQAGAVYLPLNTAYTFDELSYFVGNADPALIVCHREDEDRLRPLAHKANARLLSLASDGGSLTELADRQETRFTTHSREPDDLAALLYTSGTTGRSKGAMMSHRNLLSNARTLVDMWRITRSDRLIHALPIFHTHGLFVAMNTSLLAGARVRLMERFDVSAIIDELPRSTMLMGVPTFYTRLLSDAKFTRETCENMRLFISGSAPLLAETHLEFERRTGHRILERYGMTETNMITSNPYDGARVAGTVGFPLPGCEVKITDTENGESLPRGEVGMIEVRGDNVFQGYWRMPDKTAEELRSDRFFITGDLGFMDEHGRVSIVGRAKDLIISGGYNIYPKEVENVINALPGVVESAVFGVPDPDFGESVVAAVVTDQGATIDADDLRAAVSNKLARFKCPKRYVVLDDLPRNTMGKVQKNELRRLYAE